MPSSRYQREQPWYEKVLMWVGILTVMVLVGWCSHVTGTGRATVSDVRAIERQIQERCR